MNEIFQPAHENPSGFSSKSLTEIRERNVKAISSNLEAYMNGTQTEEATRLLVARCLIELASYCQDRGAQIIMWAVSQPQLTMTELKLRLKKYSLIQS